MVRAWISEPPPAAEWTMNSMLFSGVHALAAGAVVAAGAAGAVAAGAAALVGAAAGAVVAAGLAGAVVAAGAAAGPPQAATRKTSAIAMDRIDSPKNRLRISTLLP